MLEAFIFYCNSETTQCFNSAEILFQRSKKLTMSTVFNPFF